MLAVAHPVAASEGKAIKRARMTMWLLGNRKEQQHDGENTSSSSSSKFSGKALRNKLLGRESPRSEANMRLAETFSGIEVSLSNDNNNNTNNTAASNKKYQSAEDLQTMSSTPTESSHGTVFSIKEQLDELRKPHFVQFQLPDPPEDLSEPSAESISNRLGKQRNHRIPLFRSKFFEKSSYESVFQLLRSHSISSERHLLRHEISLLDKEIEALQEDRNTINRISTTSSPRTRSIQASKELDIHRQLLVVGSPKRGVSSQLKRSLREERGLCLTVRIGNSKTLESLLSKTAYRTNSLSPKRKSPATRSGSDVISIRPDQCREGGAAATLQHISLLPQDTNNSSSAVFLSRDNGKSSYCGSNGTPLPEPIQRRLKENSISAESILYIAIGTGNYYYIQFRSGETWWSGSAADTEFDAILGRWDVQRVAFGAATVLGTHAVAVSWVVVARDGKVAWKNIPRRLEGLLLSKSTTAPAEIALGTNGSFFLKFMDGACVGAGSIGGCCACEWDVEVSPFHFLIHRDHGVAVTIQNCRSM